MAIQKINITEFLQLAKLHTLIDVRSEGEYNHAHLPGAYNLPLFNNEERKIVGTAYKQESREKAIKIGLDFFGKKMVNIVEQVEKLTDARCQMENKMTDDRWQMTEKKLHDDHKQSTNISPFNFTNHQQPTTNLSINPSTNDQPSTTNGSVNRHLSSVNYKKIILLYCWRGGMRSAGVAWLLDLYGFKVYTLSGGYKSFRNWVLKQFELPYHFKILGGYTGSGKTEVIKELALAGESVLDLEGLANHKGSAFGAIGEQPQPSQEMFENKIALKLDNVKTCLQLQIINSELTASNIQYSTLNIQHSTFYKPPTTNYQPPTIWLEDESRRIGNLTIPPALWKSMRQSPLFFLEIPFEERLDHIIEGYGKFDKEQLINAIIRIKKRLGGLETKTAINHLLDDEVKDSFSILLRYYDRLYLKGMQNRESPSDLITKVECDKVAAKSNAKKLINLDNR